MYSLLPYTDLHKYYYSVSISSVILSILDVQMLVPCSKALPLESERDGSSAAEERKRRRREDHTTEEIEEAMRENTLIVT